MSLIAVVRIQLLETRLPQHGALQSEDDSAAGALQQRQGRSGMRVIVDIAGGSPLPDGPAVVGALQLLCTCIGSSAPPLTGRAGLLIASGKPLTADVAHAAALGCSWANLHWDVVAPNSSCRRVWQALQDLDGIRMLSGLLRGGHELAGQVCRRMPAYAGVC
jgi:hypothetical protein